MTLRRFYGSNHLHFLTTGTYRRARIFDSLRFKRQFISTLAERVAKSFASQKLFGFLPIPKRKAADFENRKVCATCYAR